MNPTVKKFLADALAAGVAAIAVLTVLLNAVHGLNVPAADIAWLTGAIAVVSALVNVLRPYASSAVKSVFKG